MKQLLLQTIACCAVLMPFPQAQAKTFGGLAPGKTFTFTVNFRASSKTVGITTTDKVPVPAGVPNYKSGSKVTFTIGRNGQLTAKGLSMAFKSVDRTTNPGRESNIYELPPKPNYPFGDSGTLAKTSPNTPVGLSLNFTRVIMTGGVATTYRVFYSLDLIGHNR